MIVIVGSEGTNASYIFKENLHFIKYIMCRVYD